MHKSMHTWHLISPVLERGWLVNNNSAIDLASVYARAMKEQEIDGEALLHLNADHLEELGVSSEHRSLLLARIRDLPLTRSTAS